MPTFLRSYESQTYAVLNQSTEVKPVARVTAGAYVHHTEYLHFSLPKRYALVNATERPSAEITP